MATGIPIQRFPWADEAPSSIGSSSNSNIPNRKWRSWLPLFVALVFIAEISFLSKIDMAEKANLVNSWADSFYQFTTSSRSTIELAVDEAELGVLVSEVDQGLVPGGCEEWLEREDSVAFSRDFDKEPILVRGREQTLNSCSVGCKFGTNFDKKSDAAFRLPRQAGIASVLQSMESAQYYAENNITLARRWKGI